MVGPSLARGRGERERPRCRGRAIDGGQGPGDNHAMSNLVYFLRRLRLRIVWSVNGLVDAWREQHSFRTWVWANLVSTIAAFVLPLTWGERALILSLGLVLLAFEAINTAIEYTVDYISTDRHPLAGRAKDAGSAGVFLASLAAGAAWVMVLVRLAL